MTGIEPSALCAEISTFVPGRQLDDNACMLLRYDGGARGSLWASQVAHGQENGLALAVYGERGGLEWHQEHPNELLHTSEGQPTRILTRNGPGSRPVASRACRVPPGHPEGYLEGFAQLYTDIAELIHAHREGRAPSDDAQLVPTVEDGARGVRFIEAVLESSTGGGIWVDPRLTL